jgi:hypothetical protein
MPYGVQKGLPITNETTMRELILRKNVEMSEVPGFDGHLENDNGFTGLQPATDVALPMTARKV